MNNCCIFFIFLIENQNSRAIAEQLHKEVGADKEEEDDEEEVVVE